VQSIATCPPYVYALMGIWATHEADGGAPSVMAEMVDSTTALQADTGCVYWLDARSSAVMMVHE
jgi:hypothetical protein